MGCLPSQCLRQLEGFGDVAFDQARRDAIAHALDADAGETRVALELQIQVLARAAADHRHDPIDVLDPLRSSPGISRYLAQPIASLPLKTASDDLTRWSPIPTSDMAGAERDVLDGGAAVEQRAGARLRVRCRPHAAASTIDLAAIVGEKFRRARRLPVAIVVDDHDLAGQLDAPDSTSSQETTKFAVEPLDVGQDLAAERA